MKPANVRLQLRFDLQLAVPDELRAADPARLQAALSEALGSMVLQGLPTIAGKQLARVGVELHAHQCALDTQVIASSPTIPRDELVMAGPHLTDAELDRLVARMGSDVPGAASERQRALRRHALAITNEFRLVPCVVHAVMTSEQLGTLEATLNLTNGSVMIEPHDRDKRLRAGQDGVQVEVSGLGASLDASYAGHTISGPVIEVPLTQVAAHRDGLIGIWQQSGA